MPEDRISVSRLIPMGLQHVVAMFGATVLALALNWLMSLGEPAPAVACDPCEPAARAEESLRRS